MGTIEVRASSEAEAKRHVRNIVRLRGQAIPIKAVPTRYRVTYRMSYRKSKK